MIVNGFKCQECGRKFKTARAAERATYNGCPGCGGGDIDIDPDAKPPKPKAKPVEKPAPTRTVEVKAEDGFAVAIKIPVGSMDPPTEKSVLIMTVHQDSRGWKYPIKAFVTTDRGEADDYAYCLNWYCGGHELETVKKPEGTFYVVSSKGYYHYVGA